MARAAATWKARYRAIAISRRETQVRFAAASSLEGDGFEPSVPHKKQPFLAAPVRFRNSPSATKTGPFVPGTDGSNPSPANVESAADGVEVTLTVCTVVHIDASLSWYRWTASAVALSGDRPTKPAPR